MAARRQVVTDLALGGSNMKAFRAARFIGALSLATVMGLSLAACDGDQSSSGGSAGSAGSGGSGVLGDHGDEYASALCGSIFKCCNAADLVEIFNSSLLPGGSVVDYAGCRILYRTVWDAALEPVLIDS